MKIAMIGTRGVPARYGGFETAIEEIGSRLAARGEQVVVFCRPVKGEARPRTYRGMQLVSLPALRFRALETVSHTALSVVRPELAGIDAAILFNAANAPFLPVLHARGIPVATHVDGLEWRRSKWNALGRRYYRSVESLAVRWSDALIADAQGIADYYRAEFDATTRLITYGAPDLSGVGFGRLAELGLAPEAYHLIVARFEPENHVLEMVRGYVASGARLPLVVVGSAPYSAGYSAAVRAAANERVQLLGAVWDQQLLDELYANAASYLHGHSVGGTNPSLLRAIGAGAPTIAFDSVFNREVGGPTGWYFDGVATLARQLQDIEADPVRRRAWGELLRIRATGYTWDKVADGYLELCTDLANGYQAPRATGRRRHPGWVDAAKQGRGTAVIAHPSPELYGSDRVLLETLSALVACGRRTVLTLPESGPLVREAEARGAEVRICPSPVLRKSALRPLGMLRLALGAARAIRPGRQLLKDLNPDLLLVNTLTVPLWLGLGRAARIRTICHVHEAEASRSPFQRRLLYAPLLLADKLVVNSLFSLSVLTDSWSSLRTQASVVYNGVAGPPTEPSPPREDVGRAPRILYLGRLSPRKGPQVAVAALANLRARGVDAHLSILGSVFAGYEWFEQELRDLGAALGVSAHLEFLGFDPDIWGHLAAADIVCVPSTVDEPFGNTAVEAMLAERPLVVSDTSGLREASAGFGSARLVPPSDPSAIADAVSDLLANWAVVREQVMRDRDLAISRYAPAVYEQAMLATLADPAQA